MFENYHSIITKRLAIVFLLTSCLFSYKNHVKAQTPNGLLDFGNPTNNTTATTINTGFGGVRNGGGGGGWTLKNPGVASLGELGELRGVPPTNANLNSVGLTSGEYGSATRVSSIRFEVNLSTGGTGEWYFFAGNGATYGSAQNTIFNANETFAGIKLVSTTGSLAASCRQNGSWVSSPALTTALSLGSSHTVVIICNNGVSTQTYALSSVAPNKYDIIVDGVLVVDDASKAFLPSDTDINAFRFYGMNSPTKNFMIYLDNISWYNFAYYPQSCAQPDNSALSESSVSQTSAQLNWGITSGQTPDSVVVSWRQGTSGAFTNVGLSGIDTSYILSGLTPGSLHQWKISTYCYGNASQSTTDQFYTSAPYCPTATTVTVDSIKYYRARINWTIPSGPEYLVPDSAQIEYRKIGDVSFTTVSAPLSGGVYIGTGIPNSNNLSAGTTYQVRVKLYCSGTPKMTTLSTFTTLIPCATITSRSSANITHHSATLKWSYTGTPDSFEVNYRLAGSGVVWTKVFTSSDSINATGLNSNTSYEWRVKVWCTDNGSAVSPGFLPDQLTYQNFTTTTVPNCSAPSIVWVPSKTTNSIDLFWVATQADSYQVWYRPVGDPSFRKKTSLSTSYTMSGLLNNTEYEIKIYPVCDGYLGNYSWDSTSATLKSCTSISGLSTSNITSNSATLNWTSNADSVLVFWRATNVPNFDSVLVSNSGSHTLTGLQSNQAHIWKLRGKCYNLDSVVSWSVTTANQNFTTAAAKTSAINFAGTSIFPNPNNGNFFVKFLDEKTLGYTIEVSDITGRTIESISGVTESGENIVAVNLESNYTGMFFVKVKTDFGTEIFRVTVQH